MIKKLLSVGLCLGYFLAGSIFFHVQAMNIQSFSPVEDASDCHRHMIEMEHAKHVEELPQKDCFDTCLEGYDQLSTVSINEISKVVPIFAFIDTTYCAQLVLACDQDTRQFLHRDAGGRGFIESYIGCVKKME